MNFLIDKTMSVIAYLIDSSSLIFMLVLPIVLVWRSTICGVFMATLIIEINIILTDLLTTKLRGQQLNYEDFEYWNLIWIPVFFYCIFIWLIKFLVKKIQREPL
ncbi:MULTISPECIES: hypothetical protein [unclassified Microcoleus]|uniref:hypothetical protein n=1 Tax=unclassified Microcoleus TaxID=2642155 RepID=UPI002FD6A6F5